jgi:predicted ester cyclase
MPLTQNKLFIHKFLDDLYNNRDLTVADNVIASPILRGSIKRASQLPRETFTDFRLVVEELIEEEDKIVARCVMHGTFKRIFLGSTLVNRSIDVDIIGIFHINDQKIKGLWYLRDEIGLFKQLGPLGVILLLFKIGKRST